MKITRLDVNNIQQKKNFSHNRIKGTPDYLFVLFKSHAEVMINEAYVNADYGSFIIFDKNKPHCYHTINNETFIHDYMHFEIETEDEKQFFLKIPKGTLIQCSQPDRISNILTEIKLELIDVSEGQNSEILKYLGLLFLYRLKNETENVSIVESKRRYFQDLLDLRTNIYRNPEADWSIDKMCSIVQLSRSYFQALYKKFFYISCNEDVIIARINHAKMLLLTDSLTVNEISLKCGFSNAEHFIRLFKKKTGVTPKAFVKNKC